MEGKYRMYQGKNGAIYLHIGNMVTALTLQQINDLLIESRFYDIADFDHESYSKYYASSEIESIKTSAGIAATKLY